MQSVQHVLGLLPAKNPQNISAHRAVTWSDAPSNSVGSYECGGAVALLWALHKCLSSSPHLKGYAWPPCEGNSFRSIVLAISFFWPLPTARENMWGVGSRLTDKWTALLSGSALHQYSVCITVDAVTICLSISIYPSHINKWYTNCSTWGCYSTVTQNRQSTLLWMRTIASELKV